jgi:hypothetical protein
MAHEGTMCESNMSSQIRISPNIMLFKYTLFLIGTTNFAYMTFLEVTYLI